MTKKLLALAVLAAGAACGDGNHGGDPDARIFADAQRPDARSVPDADTGEIPRIEPAACRYAMPAELGLAEGSDYECGDLVVRENRDAEEGAIRVHYIRIFSTSGSSNATIYLDGGPGGNGAGILSYINYIGIAFLDGLLVDGDFLVIAQRGTSLSKPSLMCDQNCDELPQIADLPSYNTAFNADDVDDLRAMLGYSKLNVYGISYGSRLGLEVLRRHGDNVRAAVVGGLVPAQINWPAEVPASFYNALTALNASCADQLRCGAAFGDLVAKLMTGVASLDAEPLDFYYGDEPIELDSFTYAHLLFQTMYSKSTYPWLPLMISDVAERRTDRVGDFIGEMLHWFSGDRDLSIGLYYSVVCGELYNPPDLSAFDAANSEVPEAIRSLFSYSFYGLLDACETWPIGDSRPALSQPVTSEVRTLVANGTVDPITPPRFGEIAASTLSNSTVVIFANSGHGATLQTPCGQQTLLAFLADPDQPIDTSCAADITTDYVLPSTVTRRAVPHKQIALELFLH